MKLLLSIPSRQFVAGSQQSAPLVAELESIGFRFAERPVPGGSLLYALEPVQVELETVEQLVELQRRVGLIVKLEDGCLFLE